jgi:hypothetical protein
VSVLWLRTLALSNRIALHDRIVLAGKSERMVWLSPKNPTNEVGTQVNFSYLVYRKVAYFTGFATQTADPFFMGYYLDKGKTALMEWFRPNANV